MFRNTLDYKDNPFKGETLEYRKSYAANLLSKFADRVPIIIMRRSGDTIPLIKKQKYLVPREYRMANIILIIRTGLQLDPGQAIFVFVNNVLVPNSQDVGSTYNDHKDNDGFLYITYCSESTFGTNTVI